MRQRMWMVAACGVLQIASAAGGCGGIEGRRPTFDESDSGTVSTSSGEAASGSSGHGLGGGSGDGGTLAACATATGIAQRVPIYLDIVLDGSRSMDGYTNAATPANQATLCEPGTFEEWMGGPNGTCYLANSREDDPLQPGRPTGKKWLAARGALKAFFDARAPLADPALGVGMFLFSSTAPDSEPVRLLDPPQAARLWDLIDPGTWPEEGTPLEASIESQAAALRAFSPQGGLLPGGRRVILLITDGVPDTADLKPAVRSAVLEALEGDPSVATAVIGVGNPGDNPDTVYDATFLSKLAKLGGVSAAGCDENWSEGDSTTPCHLQVTPGASTADQLQQQFGAALEQIAGTLASCELALDRSSPIDPAKVNVVYVDGEGGASQVPQDDANGWSYDNPTDPSSVRLNGEACTRFKSDQDGRVDIVVGCPTGTEVVH